MADFNGLFLFGEAVVMITADNPRGEQLNSFPGLSGLEALDQGRRGRYTEVSGILSGDFPADLNAAENLFRSADDGNAYDLTDDFGNVWPFVKLESFQPQGRVRRFAGSGRVFRPYTARFKHL